MILNIQKLKSGGNLPVDVYIPHQIHKILKSKGGYLTHDGADDTSQDTNATTVGGSGIHIKKKNIGKFTATKKATGKSTEELTHSKNPLTRKRAVFALNSRKWKHNNGGIISSLQQGGTNYFRTNKTQYVDSVLNANQDKDWVRRLTQKNTPSIPMPSNIPGYKLGMRSTHLMSDNNLGYVFPSIQNINKKLTFLGNRAEDYARETNTGIQLPKEQGTWFARNGYKQGTNILTNYNK